MKLGIGIATYLRKDGKSKFFLERCLNHIKKQTHQDYKVFLIGDKYENHDEFLNLCHSIIDPDKIYFENLPYAKERDIYTDNPNNLWCAGGCNAMNLGVEKALREGYKFICHLDHDDYWSENHLKNISDFLEKNQDYVFVATKCNYRGLHIVPQNSLSGNYHPTEGDLTHSSVCINFEKIPFRYRDVFAETGTAYPSDADMWNRIKSYMIENNLKGYLLDEPTVFLDKEERS